MQQRYDEHIWAWRWHRFRLTGLMIGAMEICAYGPRVPEDGFYGPEYRSIDPADYHRIGQARDRR